MTKWGLIARSETDRGLGIQTFAMYENLKPDKTLVVVVPVSGFKSHVENYPDATIITLMDGLIEEEVRDWWHGLDIVVSVETLYDWRVVKWARADGVRTIVHGNPEFWMATNPQPSTWWWPTRWRLKHLPTGPIIPVPTLNVGNRAADPYSGPLRFVHVVGNKAMGDRNGTTTVQEAVRKVRFNTVINSYSQAGPVGVPRGGGSTVFNDLKPVADRWSMYTDEHALLLPRRYGGLCLPVLEAMASGLAVIMTDCVPNLDWPIIPLGSEPSKHLQMQCGTVETVAAYGHALATIMDNLNHRRQVLDKQMRLSLEWAQKHDWEHLAPMYHEAIDRAAN